MASPYSLDKGGKGGREGYQKKLAEEMKRYHGDRDRAVRSANIASGYGSSTAERFKHSGDGKAAGGGGGGGGGSKKAAPKKPTAPRADPVPTPTPRPTNFSPDLAPSPNPFQMNSPVGPGAMTGAPTNGGPMLPPMNPALSQASILQTPPPDLLPPNMQLGAMQPQQGINIGPPGGVKRPATFPNIQQPLFNDYGMKSEPQDPNEGFWSHLLRG